MSSGQRPGRRLPVPIWAAAVVLACLGSFPASAADPAHRWSTTLGGSSDDLLFDVAATQSVIAAVGESDSETLDFGGGPLAPLGSTDWIVATFDSGGAPGWSARLGGSSFDAARAVDIDPVGGLVVGGITTSPVADIGTGDLPSVGGVDMLFASYDQDGTPRWSRRLGGAGSDWVSSVASDAQGGMVFTGFTDSVAIPFAGSSLQSAGGWDMIVGRLDENGSDDWAFLIGGLGDDVGVALSIDSAGRILVAGGSTSADLDLGSGPLGVDREGDMLVLSVKPSGQIRWARRFGGTGPDSASAIDATSDGFILAGSSNSASIDLGTGPLDADTYGGYDIVIGRFNADGEAIWARRAVGHGESYPSGVAVANDDGVFLSASTLGGPFDIGGGELAGKGFEDVVIAQFGPTGAHLWSRRYGNSGNDSASSVALGPDGDAVFAGFSDSYAIDLGGGLHQSAGGTEAWLARIANESIHDVAPPTVVLDLPLLLPRDTPPEQAVVGQALDDITGVEEVWVRFAPQIPNEPSSTLPANLTCDDDRRACAFAMPTPNTSPGIYHVYVWSMDRARNIGRGQHEGVVVVT